MTGCVERCRMQLDGPDTGMQFGSICPKVRAMLPIGYEKSLYRRQEKIPVPKRGLQKPHVLQRQFSFVCNEVKHELNYLRSRKDRSPLLNTSLCQTREGRFNRTKTCERWLNKCTLFNRHHRRYPWRGRGCYHAR